MGNLHQLPTTREKMTNGETVKQWSALFRIRTTVLCVDHKSSPLRCLFFSLLPFFFFIIYAYARISFRPHFLLFLRVIKIFSSYRPSFHIAISSFHSAHLLFAVGIQLFHEGKIVVLLRKIFSTSGTQGNNNLRTHQCVINRGQNPQRFRLSFNFDIQSWDFYFSVPPPHKTN